VGSFLGYLKKQKKNSLLKLQFSIKMVIYYIGYSFKFLLKVDVEESIVNVLRITDQLFKCNLTFCVVCVFTLKTEEWCVHNRLFSATLMRNLNEHPIKPKSYRL
jgi:hypothetical protein